MWIPSQAPPLLRIREHPRREPGPVERPVGEQHAGAERLDHGGEPGGPLLDHLPGELVGVDHGEPSGPEERGHRALAGGEPAGQPEDVHQPSRPRSQGERRGRAGT